MVAAASSGAGPTWSHVKGSTETVENATLLVTTLNRTRGGPVGLRGHIHGGMLRPHCHTGRLLVQDHDGSFGRVAGTNTTGWPPSSRDLNILDSSGTLCLYPRLQGCPSDLQIWREILQDSVRSHAITRGHTSCPKPEWTSRAPVSHFDFHYVFQFSSQDVDQFHFHETIAHFSRTN